MEENSTEEKSSIELRSGCAEIDPTILGVTFESPNGDQHQLHAFRSDPESEDSFLSQLMIKRGESGEIIEGEVRMPRRLDVAKEYTLEFVHRHKKGIAIAGTVAVTAAAGTGFLIRRYKDRH